MSATTDYLERQAEALLELIEKKDAYIIRLQDEVSQKSQAIHTARTEQQNFRNSVKEFVVENVRDGAMDMSVAEALADLCDFELTKTITITSTIDFEVEVEVPMDVDADDVIASLEYSVDAFDYSITDYTVDSRNVDWEDTVS